MALAHDDDFPAGQSPLDAHERNAGGDLSSHPGHSLRDAHESTAGVAPLSPLDPGHCSHDAHVPFAGVDPSDSGHSCSDAHATSAAVSPERATLALLSDILDDYERTRIATENRARSLLQVKGGEESHPVVVNVLDLVEQTRALEHGADLQLRRVLRQHPLGPWVKATVGIGEKQGARLIAAIGWPTARDDGTPRTVSQLWAYCGYHVLPASHSATDAQSTPAGGDPSSHLGHSIFDAQCRGAGVAPSRKRGQKANWNATAKMRAYLCAEACMKQRHSPYRQVYDDARLKYAEAVHPAECKRCGPSGKPAPAGSELSEGHKHARALRLVAKAILRDLWREAKRIDDESSPPTIEAATPIIGPPAGTPLDPGHRRNDAHDVVAGVDPSDSSQNCGDAHDRHAAVSPSSHPGHRVDDAHVRNAGVAPTQQEASNA